MDFYEATVSRVQKSWFLARFHNGHFADVQASASVKF